MASTVIKRRYRRAEDTRKLVVDVATRLFYAHGIRAVGIDRVATEANVTTATLYRLFGSKDGLVVAYLEAADTRWFDWFEQTAGNDAGALESFFEELEEQTGAVDYRGCPFRMALAEYPTDASGVHQVATSNKRRTRQRFYEIVTAAGNSNPARAADQLMVLVDGICASATERSPASARGVATVLIRHIIAS
jgi:AcrR family transcriptional regulator